MVVKLGNSVGNSFPRTTNLMTALDFLVREAADRRVPIAGVSTSLQIPPAIVPAVGINAK